MAIEITYCWKHLSSCGVLKDLRSWHEGCWDEESLADTFFFSEEDAINKLDEWIEDRKCSGYRDFVLIKKYSRSDELSIDESE